MTWLSSILMGSALAGTWQASVGVTDQPVLVVSTPGFSTEAHLPLVRALVADGNAVAVWEAGCTSRTAGELVADLVAARQALAEPPVVVGHGLGATLALMAAPQLQAERFVLLAPILEPPSTAVFTWLAEQEVKDSVNLGNPVLWSERDVASLVVGEPELLGCAPASLLVEAQQWLQAGQVPIDLEKVHAPVWIGVSVADEVAGVETAIPASRALSCRKVVRLGINRQDPQDFNHGELLTHRIPVRLAARQVRSARNRCVEQETMP